MESKTETQNLAIARYLLGGGRLTALDALEQFGCMRLASRICDLRTMIAAGIHDDFIELGNGKRVKQYWVDSADVRAVNEVREMIRSGNWFEARAEIVRDASKCEPAYIVFTENGRYRGMQ